MNKKIFASALFAVAAFVSTIASAQITYTNSVADADYNQDATAVVGAGGSAVRANDLIIVDTSGGLIPADATVIVRLPAGLNFDGAPSYLVSPATPTQGLTLKDGTQFGDPTLNNPGITLNDTDGDGGMDRALVTVGAASAAGDELIISLNVKANASATAGIKKASLIVNNGLAVVQDVATVLSSLSEPVNSSSGTALTSVDQNANPSVGVTTATAVITIPAGTANGKTITLTPQSKVQWEGTSTVTYTVLTPGAQAVGANLFTNGPSTVAINAPAGATATLTLTLNAPAVGGLVSDVQILLSVNVIESLAGGTVGLRGLAVAGTAGISGNVQLLNVLANGSKATLTSGAKATNIVAGSTAEQTLPSITIVENFVGDAATATTPTITITGSAGLKFGSTATITVNGVAPVTATVTTNASQLSVLTVHVPVASLSPTSKTLTITGIKATAASTASGDLTAKVGSPSAPDLATAPSDTLVVAVAVPVGTVTVKGPTTPATAGPGVTPPAGTVTLTESTYGAITLANASQVEQAFFRVTPSSNATINSVGTTVNGYANPPVFAACVAESGVTTGAWLCVVTAESQSLAAGTDTVTVTIGYSVKSTASIGSTVTATFDGNAGVSGTVTLANIGVSTSATKGIIPDLTPGVTEAQQLATVTIKENFAGAIKNGAFRLIAPTGVTFNDVSGITLNAGAVSPTGTISIADTFAPSDTLVIDITGTDTVTFTPQAVIGPNVSGFVSFNITDGDINGEKKTSITNESIVLAYADGTLEAIDAGADVSVNVNFSATNTVEGGLPGFTATSSNSAVASVTLAGTQLTITGEGEGSAVITVVDQLGGPADTVTVNVTVGAVQPDAVNDTKTSDGSVSAATFTTGASTDGGDTFGTEFSASDEVTIVATFNVDPADQGTDGELYVAIKSTTDDGTAFAYLNEDGSFATWDLTIVGLGEVLVAEPLGSTYNVHIFSGNLAAGKHRIALAYSTADGKFVYTGKAIVITVTE